MKNVRKTENSKNRDSTLDSSLMSVIKENLHCDLNSGKLLSTEYASEGSFKGRFAVLYLTMFRSVDHPRLI